MIKAPRLKSTMVTAFGHSFAVKHGLVKAPSRKGKRALGMSLESTPAMDRRNFLQQIKTSGVGSPGTRENTKSRSVAGVGSPERGSPGRDKGEFKVSDFGDFFEEASPFERIRDSGKVPDVADAFTARSVHLGVLDGVYDFEQMQQLTKVGRSGRYKAYNKRYPVVVPSQLDKMAELKLSQPEEVTLSLPQFAREEGMGGKSKLSGPSGLPDLTYLAVRRPKTTGGLGKGGAGSRQNWRGYKNLVNEFDR